MTITHIPQKRRRAMLLALAGVTAMALAGCGGGGVTNPPASAGGNNCGDFASSFSCITFDSPSVTYTLTGFGGAEDSSVVPDPTGGTNKVAKVVKSATAETCAGTTVSTGPNAVGRQDPVRRIQHAHDGARLLAERRDQGAAQGRGRRGRHALGRDRGDHHGRERLGDADVRLRQPGQRHGAAQLHLHVQQDLDLLQLRSRRRRRGREDLLLRRRGVHRRHGWRRRWRRGSAPSPSTRPR